MDISSLEFTTNLPTLEHMYITDSYNNEVVKINNLDVTALNEGATTLYLCVNYKNKIYKIEIKIIVKEINIKEENNEITFSVNSEIFEDYDVYIITFYKDNGYYYNFRYELINFEESKLIYINKFSYILEISCYKNFDFTLKIIDLYTNNYILIDCKLITKFL